VPALVVVFVAATDMAGAAQRGRRVKHSRTPMAKPAAELGRGLTGETGLFPRANVSGR